jgi:MoaA/NifB/PqqE/SkfB family radical SAM enzyme
MDWLKIGDVDLITISVAGDIQAHSTLRDGSRLDHVLSAVADLAELFRKEGVRAKIQLSYLLTRDNAASLPTLVELAAGSGVAEVFVTHLDSRPCISFVERSAFNDRSIEEEVALCLDEAEARSRSIGIKYRGPARVAEELLACALDPLRFVFVSWDGRVGPCVNLLLPVEGDWSRWNEDGEFRVEPFSYGRLRRHSLSQLLASSSRRRFTMPFKLRLAAEQRFVSSLTLDAGPGALKQLDEAEEKRRAALASHPFPEACTGCPKANGW